MGRPFYPHEADDPDLDWLVSNFLYERPDYMPVESGMLPLVLIPIEPDLDEEEGIVSTLVDVDEPGEELPHDE